MITIKLIVMMMMMMMLGNTVFNIVRVLGKKYIKRLLTVNTMYYMKPQNPI